jgi:hypothetical protein
MQIRMPTYPRFEMAARMNAETAATAPSIGFMEGAFIAPAGGALNIKDSYLSLFAAAW